MSGTFTSKQAVEGPDGQLYEVVITGEAEVTRGPLGRFVDLAAQIRADDLEVPAAVAAVLELEQRPTREAWNDLTQRVWLAGEASTVLSQLAQVVAEYNPVMEGPAAAVGAMTRIVEIFADSDLGPKIHLPEE